MPRSVAVIDIGSNSTKLLVANEIATLYENLIGARLSRGMGIDTELTLSNEAMERALRAIIELCDKAVENNADETYIVATSAVREATNKDFFCKLVQEKTGHPVKVLTGKEEARYIAQGVAHDPSMKGASEFCLFDAGGGSLECVHYKDGDILYADSLPFGIVRLTEKFISDPTGPVKQEEVQNIIDIIEEGIPHGFPHRGVPLVGTGGGVSTARNVLKQDATLHLKDMRTLMDHMCSMTMQERIDEYHVPDFRADLMPAAMALAIALMDKGGADKITHSYCNLRFGIANLLLTTDEDLNPDKQDLI